MNRNVVETNWIELLASLVAEVSDENPQRRSGSNLQCSQPMLGKWINDCDVLFLMDTLALSDKVFESEFPGIRLAQNERFAFASRLIAHCKECARCNAKQAEDIEWKLQVDNALDDNRELLAQVLTRAVGKR